MDARCVKVAGIHVVRNMEKFKWPTPGILEQVNYCKNHNIPKLTLEILEAFINKLEAESDCDISYESREEIWRKIRMGLPLTDQERLIHSYDLEVLKVTGKWK